MTNDEKIIELRDKIEKKKAELHSCRFVPVSNCIFEFDGIKWNINVMSFDELILMACKFYQIKSAIADLRLPDVILSSNNIGVLLEDILLRIRSLSVAKEKKSLQEMENKLTLLLSREKQTELEIRKFEDILK